MATPDDGLRLRLREARRGSGLIQQQVADRLGVSRRAVSEWETGERRPHSALPELAALYGVSTSWLLTGAEEAALELRELRKTVDELYEFVIQLASKTADDFAAVLGLLELEAQPPDTSGTSEPPARQPHESPVANGHGVRSRRVAQEQPERG